MHSTGSLQLDLIAQLPIIVAWASSLVGRSVTLRAITVGVGKLLRGQGHSVYTRSRYDDDVKSDDLLTAASYYEDEDTPLDYRHFEIILIANPSARSGITLTSNAANNLAINLVECLVHEYRHKHQYHTRGFLNDTEYHSTATDSNTRHKQEYMGTKMEIDAFAASIAIRLWLLFSRDSYAVLAQGVNMKWETSPDLATYYLSFGVGDPVIRRLLRKTYCRLQQLDDTLTTRDGHFKEPIC
jgi:hypothetical protein